MPLRPMAALSQPPLDAQRIPAGNRRRPGFEAGLAPLPMQVSSGKGGGGGTGEAQAD